MSATTSTASAPSASSSSGSGGGGGGGPTNSPLLFFVALGFGVVFTNLWIIVGVKYCFRYNQRNRLARAMAENGEPIDLGQVQRPHRRRREKKLMTMEEVNERFPLTKYKTFRAAREAKGLPAAGGVTASASRAASLKDDVEGTAREAYGKRSTDSTRPTTTLAVAQQDHADAIAASTRKSIEATGSEKAPEKGVIERSNTTDTFETVDSQPDAAIITVMDPEDDDGEIDPIRTAAPPEMLSAPGDSCAICLENLDDEDDVRGLTCDHAFHAACVDPWLTARRACCPLCKADYYVPKPRTTGGGAGNDSAGDRQPPHNPNGAAINLLLASSRRRYPTASPFAPPPHSQRSARRLMTNFPSTPPRSAWRSPTEATDSGNATAAATSSPTTAPSRFSFRPHIPLFLHNPAERVLYGDPPPSAGADGGAAVRPEQEATERDEETPQDGDATAASGWRSRLPSLPAATFWRRGGDGAADRRQASDAGVDLEAGPYAQGGGFITSRVVGRVR